MDWKFGRCEGVLRDVSEVLDGLHATFDCTEFGLGTLKLFIPEGDVDFRKGELYGIKMFVKGESMKKVYPDADQRDFIIDTDFRKIPYEDLYVDVYDFKSKVYLRSKMREWSKKEVEEAEG